MKICFFRKNSGFNMGSGVLFLTRKNNAIGFSTQSVYWSFGGSDGSLLMPWFLTYIWFVGRQARKAIDQ